MKFEIFKKISKLFKNANKSYVPSEIEFDDETTATDENNEFERCIVCGKLTNIHISAPIELRENYVLGCGQLCDECAKSQK